MSASTPFAFASSSEPPTAKRRVPTADAMKSGPRCGIASLLKVVVCKSNLLTSLSPSPHPYSSKCSMPCGPRCTWECSTNAYDGDWGEATIRGEVLTWQDGKDAALTYVPSGVRMTTDEGICTATLTDGKIVWSDGQVWERAGGIAPSTPDAAEWTKLSEKEQALCKEVNGAWTNSEGAKMMVVNNECTFLSGRKFTIMVEGDAVCMNGWKTTSITDSSISWANDNETDLQCIWSRDADAIPWKTFDIHDTPAQGARIESAFAKGEADLITDELGRGSGRWNEGGHTIRYVFHRGADPPTATETDESTKRVRHCRRREVPHPDAFAPDWVGTSDNPTGIVTADDFFACSSFSEAGEIYPIAHRYLMARLKKGKDSTSIEKGIDTIACNWAPDSKLHKAVRQAVEQALAPATALQIHAGTACTCDPHTPPRLEPSAL
eukprot:gene29071-biopygen66341